MNVRKIVKRFASVIIAMSLLAACDEPEEATAPADHPKLVKTIVLGGARQGSGISLPGRVDAVDKVELAFQVDGPLIELPIVEGQRVKQGDLLARIDPRDYENFLDAAKAKLSEARRQYERYAALIKTRTSPVSKAEVDEKKADYETARSITDQAQKDLNDTYLRAPFDGQIAARYVNNYENFEAKQVILRIEGTASVEVIVDIPEDIIAGVKDFPKPGEEVGAVSLDAAPALSFPVSLRELATRADPTTQTYRARLIMPSPKEINVLPGMTATFFSTVGEETENQRFFLPRTAVAELDENPVVWIVDMDSMTVSKRTVKIEQRTDDGVEVVEGLRNGERIVETGVDLLQESDKVRLYFPGMLGA